MILSDLCEDEFHHIFQYLTLDAIDILGDIYAEIVDNYLDILRINDDILSLSAKNGYSKIVKILISRDGAIPRSDVLFVAMKFGRLKVIKVLMEWRQSRRGY